MIKQIIKNFFIVKIDDSRNSWLRELFLSPGIFSVTATLFYRLLRKKVKILSSLNTEIKSGLEHNLKYRNKTDLFRPNKCFRIIRSHSINLSNAKLLVIGPRNFSELLLAYLHGFSWKNISGVDLYSEFNKVKLGSIEELPFRDNEFDIIVCSGVLNYVVDLKLSLDNMVRICKNNGLLVLQTDLIQIKDKKDYNLVGHLELDDKIKLINHHVSRISFREDIENRLDNALHQFAAFYINK